MALTSFGFREKWLRMLLKVIPNREDIFSNLSNKENMEEAQYLLGGIGNKQVEALKEWGLGIGLIERSGKNDYILTKLGRIIFEYDPQLFEYGTLWAIHYNLCVNPSKSEFIKNSNDIWFYARFANSFGAGIFTRQDLKENLKEYKKDGKSYSDSVIEKMCLASLLECMLHSRLGSELGVLSEVEDKKNVYERRAPKNDSLHHAILTYMVYDWASINDRLTVNIAELLNYGSVACFMAINEQQLSSYLSKIHERYNKRVLWVSFTAGLNSIAFEKNIPPLALLRSYYLEQQAGMSPLDALNRAIEIEHSDEV